MGKVRFLHTADWQLGMRRHFLGEEALPRFVQARIDAIRSIGRLAADRGCEFVTVAGDVFESNQIDRRTLGRALEALAEIPCPVFLLPGNHDPLDAGSLYRSPLFLQRKAGHVHLLSSTEPVEVRPGVEIVGAPWSSKRPRRDLVADACAGLERRAGVLRVCVAHGAVDTLAPDRDDPALIEVAAVERAMADGRLHFLALGDRHSTTEVAERIWYAGAPEPTDYGETEPGFVLVVELGEEACIVERAPIATWRFRLESVRLDGVEDVQALEARLDGMADKDRTILKLSLVGSIGLRARARLDEALARAGELFGAVEIWDRHSDLVVLPDDLDLAELGLAGFAESTSVHLTERAESGDPGARDALALLYRLAGGADA